MSVSVLVMSYVTHLFISLSAPGTNKTIFYPNGKKFVGGQLLKQLQFAHMSHNIYLRNFTFFILCWLHKILKYGRGMWSTRKIDTNVWWNSWGGRSRESKDHRLECNNKRGVGATGRCGYLSAGSIQDFVAGYHVDGGKSSGYNMGENVGLSTNLEIRRLHLLDTKSLGNIKCLLSFWLVFGSH